MSSYACSTLLMVTMACITSPCFLWHKQSDCPASINLPVSIELLKIFKQYISHLRSGSVRYLVALRSFNHHWYVTAPNELLAKCVLAAIRSSNLQAVSATVYLAIWSLEPPNDPARHIDDLMAVGWLSAGRGGWIPR